MRRCSIVLLLVAACAADPLSTLAPQWSASPPALELPAVAVGFTSTATLDVRNDGRVPVAVTATAEPPFSTPESLSLAPGESAPLAVTFQPATPGPASASLTLHGDGTTTLVPLTALALAPATCADSPCRTSTPAPDGTCASTPAHDGASCATACVSNAVCLSGECVGTAIDCADDDPCTADVCDPLQGCLHPPAACPAPADPCRAAACDPRTGCTSVVVADGTTCGASDCATARVCIAGACVLRLTPDGFACGTLTPCQPAGTCHAHVCVQPPPQLLPPVWTYRPAVTLTSLDFPGIADAHGDVFWTECDGSHPLATRCELVSANLAGAIRFRAPLRESTPQSYASFGDAVLAGDAVVLAGHVGGALEAHDAASGALRWSRDLLATVIAPALAGQPCPTIHGTNVLAESLTSDGVGHLAVFASVWPSCTQDQGHLHQFIVGIDAATGAVRFTSTFLVTDPFAATPGLPAEGAFDEAGVLYAVVRGPTVSDVRLLALDPNGSERWRHPLGTSDHRIGALAAGRLLLFSPQTTLLVDTSSGAIRSTWQPLDTNQTALMTADRALVVNAPYTGAQLFTLDLRAPFATNATLQAPTTTLPWYHPGQPILTSRSTFVESAQQSNAATTARLDEYALDGTLRFSCPISGSPLARQPTLRGGQWTMFGVSTAGNPVISSFPVPGLEPAASGWVTGRGKVTQEGRPR